MDDAPLREVVVIADAPGALIELCGVTLLERLLRTLQRVGVRKVRVASSTPDAISSHVTRYSAARADLRIMTDGVLAAGGEASIPADRYYDARLIRALVHSRGATMLVDSNPPAALLPLFASCPKSPVGFFSGGTIRAHDQPASIDAATFPPYAPNLRRELRPVWFPAPDAKHRAIAECVIIDAAQKGALDIPAIVHAPIENFIIARLCRTRVTPNQITLFGFAVAITATAEFAIGRFVPGVLIALTFGVLDGLDGKLARIKVETSDAGEWEHVADYLVETSWWIALGLSFWHRGVAHALPLLIALLTLDALQRITRRTAKRRLGRDVDAATPFDRGLRLVSGRRNIYIWIFAGALLISSPARGFLAFCAWGIFTHVVSIVRHVSVFMRRSSSMR